jgi:predicted MFS family arabinose efflux permease
MVWALYNVGFITVLAFGPSFLIARGLPLTLAAAIVSVVTWTCLLSNLIGGYLAERLGSRDVTMIMCLIAVALLLGGLTLGASPVLICLALGLLIGPPAGLIMALPGEAVRTQNRTAAMGVYYTCFYAAMAGLVPVAGHLRDAFGAAAPLIFGATMMLTACVSLVCFRVVQRRTRGVPPAVTSAGA